MMLLLLTLLVMPACATVAGLVVWALHRREPLHDGELVRNFLVVLALCVGLAYGLSRTDSVRLRVDPVYRMNAELEAHPLYVTIREHAPDDERMLRAFLVQHMSQGDSLSNAFLRARPLLNGDVLNRLGFADQQTKVMWGRVVANSLKELQSRDTLACYHALGNHVLDEGTLMQGFSPENSLDFQRAVINVYQSADRGMRRDTSPQEEPTTFEDAAREFRAVQADLELRFGPDIAKQIAAKKFPEVPAESPATMCAARIFELEAMLQRPKGLAARLIDSALR